MYSTKYVRFLLPISWLIISFYYIIHSINIDSEKSKNIMEHTLKDSLHYNTVDRHTLEEDNNEFLIDTPGCSIPNYMKTLRIQEAEHIEGSSCGSRAVYVHKVSEDEIAFTIDDIKMAHYNNGKKYSCCYQFAYPSIISGREDYTELRYSSCEKIKNNDLVELKREIITVTCTLLPPKKRVIYEDAYVILKKQHRQSAESEHVNQKPWNVIILGMDTMSRARLYNSMPKTAKYMVQNNWLDFRGYQKVGYNTYPNVMSLLTGRKMSTVFRTCASGMDLCNHLLIWSEFKKSGYVTATGEENLRLPDTFSKLGYKSPPTDHYLRPLFLTGESTHGNIICTKKTASAKHILNYASMFAETYKDENFFGMFWFNSFSHNTHNIPTLIDMDVAKFFSKLNEIGILNNTFIYFLSDHGIRSGAMREHYESYYEERLPMFFLWVPTEFQNTREQEYNNLKVNQYKLLTPYDLYVTLYDTIGNPQDNPDISSEACPECKSIFNEISIHRTCDEAGVDEKWCSCHEMANVNHNDDDVIVATNLAVTDLQNRMRTIKSTECMKCEVLNLKNVLRTHTYRDESRNSTYFVIAFTMVPGDVGYEVTVVKRNETFNLIFPTHTITVYNTRGNCVVESKDREFCVCKKIHGCTVHHN